MKIYKIHLRIKGVTVKSHELDMYETTSKKWLEIRTGFKALVEKSKAENHQVSIQTEIVQIDKLEETTTINEIYVNGEHLAAIFSRLVIRMCRDFSSSEEIRLHEESLLTTSKEKKKLKRIERYAELVGKKEKTVNQFSLKAQNKQLSMSRNLEYITKLHEIGEKTKDYYLSDLASMIGFNKTHSSLRYILELVGIEYKRYR